jgi:hypothetical protein
MMAGGKYKRKLNDLNFQLVNWAPVARPSGTQVANLDAPTKAHVCILNNDDYIAVTGLKSCTGLALYDADSKLAAMYHFGGHFGKEQKELGAFAEQLSAHHVELGRLQMWLFGSTTCGYADKLLEVLRALGFIQTPGVMEIDGVAHPSAAFYLLGTGVVTHQLT